MRKINFEYGLTYAQLAGEDAGLIAILAQLAGLIGRRHEAGTETGKEATAEC